VWRRWVHCHGGDHGARWMTGDEAGMTPYVTSATSAARHQSSRIAGQRCRNRKTTKPRRTGAESQRRPA
jgi:hypothetical protein